MLLHLGHVEAAQRGGSGALGEQADGGSLAQPLGQPGEVAIAAQVIGVQPAAQTEGGGVTE